MALVAITPDYAKHVDYRDTENKFHGNQLTYVHWEEHNMFCSAIAFPLPGGMPFGAFVSEVIAPHYAAHPDAASIDWGKVEWMIDGKKATPDFDKSLTENGMKHKSLVRFWTPGLKGYQGTCS